jgi:hypothetical protein
VGASLDTHLQLIEILVFVRRFGRQMLDEVSESAENARCVFTGVNINEQVFRSVPATY